MSDTTKAVFLSYASQDADAAKRICDALRQAGVEVWFDQSELRGGDTWDAMIRKRIKDCALFVPIITPNTNARAEGYFRLEWKLAVDRSHLMADDAPFLFPIVIGDLTDATARVPDKFREVQWTRLRLDETPTELGARVAKLLSGDMEAAHPRAGAQLPKTRGRWQWWMIYPVIGTIMGLMFAALPLWRAIKGPPPKRHIQVPVAVAPGSSVPAVSEARQLAFKARAMIEAIDSSADDFAAAEGLAKRALELDATDGEIWAVSSRINSSYLSRGFERGSARREAARSQAERAVKLAPDSVEVWLALGRGIGMTDPARAEEAFRRGLTLAPQEGRLLLGLGSIYRQQNRFDEALAIYEEAAARPESRALARYDQYLIHFYSRRFAEADRCLREAISVFNSSNMVAGLALLEITWRGDVAVARQILNEAPVAMRGQPRVVLATALAGMMAGQPDEALRAFDRLPADYVNDAWYTGPKALLVGLAHHQAGRTEAARLAWESGVSVVRRRLQELPNDSESHLRLGELLAWTGQTDAALQEARVFNELVRGRSMDWTFSAVRIHAALGRVDDALPLLEQLLTAPSSNRWPLTPALLRNDPLWSKLRGDPRFQKLCEEPAAPVAALTPARALVEKIRVLLLGLEATREDFALAEDYCQRALKLDSTDGEVWAVYAQLHSAFGYRGWDTSPERREQNRVMAERAIRLAPTSVQARLAQAGAWSAFGINRAETEKLLRDVVAEQPDNQPALRFLAVTMLNQGKLDECLALNERSAALPGGDPLALFNNARYLWLRNRQDEGYAMLLRSHAQKPFSSSLALKANMEIVWRSDPEAAEATLRLIPQSDLLEDRANFTAGLVYYYQRRADAALAAWGAFPRDYYADFAFDGPKGLLVGLAHELGQRDAAARIEWRTALQVVEKRLAAAPNKPAPYYHQAYLLACLGEKAAAGEALRTYEQLTGLKPTPESPMPIELAFIYARLGRFDDIFAQSPTRFIRRLRGDPRFDALRADPRYQALLAAAPAPGVPLPAPAEQPKVDQKSVAVLAFANLSSDKEQEYFSDGISEELLNVLAKIPGLKVSARTSAFYFKGKEVPIPEIAKQLGVAYVVEGSVRKQGDKVRITAQLIKAADGFHVWSDTFTRDLKDIFAVQDEITGLIAKNLQLKMGITAARPTIDLEAYQEYLAGRAAAAKAGNADLREAVTHFERSVAQEPNFTAAWVQLASAHTQLGRWGGAPTLQSWAAARAAIDRARALEPDSPDMLLALGWILRTAEWNWRGAEQAFRRSLQLRPDHPDALAGAAVLLFNIGQTEEAFRLGQQAAQLDPLNAATQIDLSIMFYLNHNWIEAEQSARRALQLAPGGGSYHSILGWSLTAQRRYDEAEAEIALDNNESEQAQAFGSLAIARGQGAVARKWLARLEEIALTHGDSSDVQMNIAWLSVGLGDTDRAFAALEKARATRDPSLSWLRNSWYLGYLHSDPRWPAFLRKVGLADDQLK